MAPPPQGVGVTIVARADQIEDLATELRPEQVGVGLGDHGGEPQVLGVVGNDQEVEGPLELCAHPVAGDDHLAAGEAVGRLGPEAATDHARIRGVRGVGVGITPEDPLGVPSIEVGGVLLLPDLDVFLLDGVVLCRCAGCEHQHQAGRKDPDPPHELTS
jgi:hypothetical protein